MHTYTIDPTTKNTAEYIQKVLNPSHTFPFVRKLSMVKMSAVIHDEITIPTMACSEYQIKSNIIQYRLTKRPTKIINKAERINCILQVFELSTYKNSYFFGVIRLV